MNKYVIKDVWVALKLAFSNFFGIILLYIILTYLTEKTEMNIYLNKYFFIFLIILFIQSIIIYFANRKYTIDIETGLITFPRSDIENSIFAILILKPYWNLMRTQTIHCNEVDNMYLDTQRKSYKTSDNKTKKKINYNLNIVGIFGSANLLFESKQKRDEVRNAINQVIKHHKNTNIDRKVAEFE